MAHPAFRERTDDPLGQLDGHRAHVARISADFSLPSGPSTAPKSGTGKRGHDRAGAAGGEGICERCLDLAEDLVLADNERLEKRNAELEKRLDAKTAATAKPATRRQSARKPAARPRSKRT